MLVWILFAVSIRRNKAYEAVRKIAAEAMEDMEKQKAKT